MNHTTNTYRGLFAVLVLAVLALSFMPSAVTAASTDVASYTVTLLKYEPVPASPGDIVDAYIQVTNTGGMAGKPLMLRVQSSYPFSPASAADAMTNLGSIAASSSLVQHVSVAVDGRVQDGIYNLPVAVSDDGATWSSTDLQIQVRATSSVLSVTSAAAGAGKDVIPGTPFDFVVVAHNTQASVLRDASLALNLDGSNFVPVGMTTKQTISRVDGNGDATYTFTLVADPKAASGVYRIPLTFSFTTAEGTPITQAETAGIVVHAAPEIAVIVDKVAVFTDNKQGTVVLRVVNKGLSQIKFTQMTIQPGTGYTVADSSKTAYIGNIDSDDFQTNEFTITPTGASKDLALTVDVTYRDALNQEYSQTYTLPVTLGTPASSGSFSPLAIIIVVIVVVGGFFWWRRSKAKKK